MMRLFLFLSVGFCLAFKLSATTITLVPMKSYKELDYLPPQIEATFSLSCQQQFLKVIRYEIFNEKTGVIRIFIGALVEESTHDCQTPDQEIAVRAGSTFSGRYYEVLPMAAQ